jgi:hypothetical protein
MRKSGQKQSFFERQPSLSSLIYLGTILLDFGRVQSYKGNHKVPYKVLFRPFFVEKCKKVA